MHTTCCEFHLALLPQVESFLGDGTIYVFSLVKRSQTDSIGLQTLQSQRSLFHHLPKFLTEKMEAWKNNVAFYRLTPVFVRTKPLWFVKEFIINARDGLSQ